jgi:hypothetical protein
MSENKKGLKLLKPVQLVSKKEETAATTKRVHYDVKIVQPIIYTPEKTQESSIIIEDQI